MPAAKVCSVCGMDVSNHKRVKDARGSYYCHPCWNAKANAASVPVASPAMANASASGDVSLDDLAELESAAASQGATQPHLVACSVCGDRFPYADIRDRDGQPVCGECFWKVAAAAASAPPGGEASESGRTKECPFCAERIQAKARKCRFCGEMIDDDGNAIPIRAVARPSSVQAASGAGANPAVSVVQVAPNVVKLQQPLGAAFRTAVRVLSNVGDVREQNAAQGIVTGTAHYGMNTVKVKITLSAAGGSTRATVEAGRGDLWGSTRKNVTRRLVETFCNLDNPQYRPKRYGVGPAGVLVIVVAIAAILVMGALAGWFGS